MSRGGSIFGRLAGLCARHPWPVLGLIAALAIAASVAALRLQTDAGTETLVDKNDPTFKATERFKQEFGDDAVVILAEGDLRELVLTDNLGKLLALEGCLSGRSPSPELLAQQPEVCQQIAELNPSQVVFGPATFLNQSVVQIEGALRGQIGLAQQQAKHAAAKARRKAADQGLSETEQESAAGLASRTVLQNFQNQLFQIATQYDITRAPRLDDPVFVSKIVFDATKPAGTPKSRFSYLFPNADSALISVRMRPGLSESQRNEAIKLFEQATNDPKFKLEKGRYVVSGVPAVVEGLADSLRTELFVLLAVAIVVMAIVLGLVLVPPLRLLPLAVALAAAGLTFGALSLTGGSLTMASIAVLPVLIGLAVDYAIQLQARWAEARAEGLSPTEAATSAAAHGGPVVGAAVLATAAGFAALALSPVPMVRAFGLLLVLGVVLGFGVALTGGLAALSIASRPRKRAPRPPGRLRRLGERIELGRARTGLRLRDTGTRAIAVAIASPGRVLIAAGALALCGWVAGSQSKVVSDIRELAPSDLPALEAVTELQDQTGVSGELNVIVRSADLADPKVLNWMRSYQQRVLDRHGFSGGASCQDADVCPAVSLPDLFGETGATESAAQARALLASIPPYFSQAVISRGPGGEGIGDTANIAFGIPVMPLDEQQRLIDDIREQIDPPGLPGPPAGTDAEVAGLPALAAAANQDLSRSRYWLPLVALLAVGLVLALVYRSVRRALVPLVPIVLATGWSALIVAAMDIPLNPMSATLGALVIAIATEFSVILSARYEGERAAGLSVGEALRRTYERTGTAVLASGVTAIAGFATLAASDIQMLRDFGLVTIADLAVALAGVMLVLPAVLVWAESAREAPAASGWLARLLSPARSPAPHG